MEEQLNMYMQFLMDYSKLSYKMKIWIKIFLISLHFLCLNLFAQVKDKNEIATKNGWSLGAFPVLGYDADVGFEYGAIANLYHYGDGTIYPNYNHSIFLEVSRSTKGSGTNQLTYDSGVLLSGFRMAGDIAYLTEQTLDFFGFNGYEAEYNPGFTNRNNSNYISEVYYKQRRELFRFTMDFQYEVGKLNLWLVAGAGYYNANISTVNINELNKGRDDSEKLPNVNTLYDNYNDWGILSIDQRNGGNNNILKLGVVYDSRENEANPMYGIWSELFFQSAPSFLGNDFSFSQLILTHRQFFTLIKDNMNFAYRIGYQVKLSGETPFYMLPFVYYSNKPTRDGLGGSRTLRGIMRNRVVGDGFIYSNFEVRWKVLRTILFNQNLYIALSTFVDMGMITQKYNYPTSNIPDTIDIISNEEAVHLSYGLGLNFAMNTNFIISFSYGFAADKRDGESGLYIIINYLF